MSEMFIKFTVENILVLHKLLQT